MKCRLWYSGDLNIDDLNTKLYEVQISNGLDFKKFGFQMVGLNGKRTNARGCTTAISKPKNVLCSDPVVAYPQANRPFSLIVDAATGTENQAIWIPIFKMSRF